MGETPEKRPAKQQGPALKKPQVATGQTAACSEPVSTFSQVQAQKKAKSERQKSDESAKFTSSLSSSAAVKKSPQKQASLMSYFKPANKKRQGANHGKQLLVSYDVMEMCFSRVSGNELNCL